jgi:IS5 family transposase
MSQLTFAEAEYAKKEGKSTVRSFPGKAAGQAIFERGQQWNFGMKMHIGMVATLGLIHRVETTYAEVHDIVIVDKLLHGKEKAVWGDAGCVGIERWRCSELP